MFTCSETQFDFIRHKLIGLQQYRIYSCVSCPAYKLTTIPAAENVAKIGDPHISR